MCEAAAVSQAGRPADSGTTEGRPSLGLCADEKLCGLYISESYQMKARDDFQPTDGLWEYVELVSRSQIFKTSWSNPGVVAFAYSCRLGRFR